jgi:hypothetical protein
MLGHLADRVLRLILAEFPGHLGANRLTLQLDLRQLDGDVILRPLIVKISEHSHGKDERAYNKNCNRFHRAFSSSSSFNRFTCRSNDPSCLSKIHEDVTEVVEKIPQGSASCIREGVLLGDGNGKVRPPTKPCALSKAGRHTNANKS